MPRAAVSTNINILSKCTMIAAVIFCICKNALQYYLERDIMMA